MTVNPGSWPRSRRGAWRMLGHPDYCGMTSGHPDSQHMTAQAPRSRYGAGGLLLC